MRDKFDPDKTLEDIRELARRSKKFPSIGLEETIELLRKVEALDAWISGGGVFPTPWRVRAAV